MSEQLVARGHAGFLSGEMLAGARRGKGTQSFAFGRQDGRTEGASDAFGRFRELIGERGSSAPPFASFWTARRCWLASGRDVCSLARSARNVEGERCAPPPARREENSKKSLTRTPTPSPPLTTSRVQPWPLALKCGTE